MFFQPNLLLRKFLNKIIKHLKKEKEIQKKIFGNELPFNIYLFHDEDLDFFAQNLKSGLEGLFNVDVTKDTSIEKQKYKNFLNDSDWLVLRHLREKFLDIPTTLSDSEFRALEQKRQNISKLI